jgi:hypothetical protein
MANKVGQPSDVISASDKLMLDVLTEAEGLTLDKRLAVLQTATRWVAVKNKLNVPEERNGFDEFREQLAGVAGAGAETAGGSEREDPARQETSLIRATLGNKHHRARGVDTARPRAAANGSGRPRATPS